MKLVTAIIRPHKLDAVKDALVQIDVPGITVTEVQGFGRQGGHTETYRGAEYKIDFVPKIKIEIACEVGFVAKIVETIKGTAQTGKIGDGKVWVADLIEIYRVRTGEMNGEAL